MQRGYTETISLAKLKITKLGLAEARHVSQQCLESGLQVAGRTRYERQNFRGCPLLFRRSSVITVPLVEFLLRVGSGRAATVRSRHFLATFDLRYLSAARCNRCAARRAGLASANTIDGQPLMKPSPDVRDHATGTEIYHLRAEFERGLEPGVGGRAMRHFRALGWIGRVDEQATIVPRGGVLEIRACLQLGGALRENGTESNAEQPAWP